VQKPFGIILFVGEGLTPQRLAAARVYMGGADAKLAMDTMPRMALLTNYSKDFAAPDQAAAASALATGEKVNNRALSVNPQNNPLTTLLEMAHARGRATGILTNAQLTNATCAAFYTHRTDGNDQDEVAIDFATKATLDVAMGGGIGHFLPQSKGGERSDQRDLLAELQHNGIEIVRTRAELEGVPAWRRAKVLGAFANGDMAFVDQLEARKDQPALSDMVRRGIELLQYNPRGYLLVVDVGLIAKAAQDNHAERTLAATLQLDRAIATARRYAGPHATILVCGDVGIGGLSVNGSPFRKDSGIALLGLNSAGQPWMTWATGPNGLKTYGNPRKDTNTPPPAAEDQAETSPEFLEPAAVYSRNALNTLEDVVAYGAGPGTDNLQGTLDNTAIFKLIRSQL
jgi:alkaline phosphatase